MLTVRGWHTCRFDRQCNMHTVWGGHIRGVYGVIDVHRLWGRYFFLREWIIYFFLREWIIWACVVWNSPSSKSRAPTW